ncbi:MAG: hypothetical protein K1X88_14570 [Nannocystaceae bacterium]|nr:hypothetical protein [Nannocystaceae bacterium]
MVPADAERDAAFESLYAIDLVYRAGCHNRCGDAFCCNFARHKQHFSFLGRRPMQELPLLAGEYEWLRARGWLAQFGEHEHREFALTLPDGRSIHADSIVSTRAGCACDHATRPVICRLYPLLPVFDVDGRLTGIESLTIYDELERIAGAPRSCAVDDLPFEQLDLLLRFTSVLARQPAWLFQLAAYRLLKQHATARIERDSQAGTSAFAAFEWAFLRRRLITASEVGAPLLELAHRHAERWGSAFELP